MHCPSLCASLTSRATNKVSKLLTLARHDPLREPQVILRERPDKLRRGGHDDQSIAVLLVGAKDGEDSRDGNARQQHEREEDHELRRAVIQRKRVQVAEEVVGEPSVAGNRLGGQDRSLQAAGKKFQKIVVTLS